MEEFVLTCDHSVVSEMAMLRQPSNHGLFASL